MRYSGIYLLVMWALAGCAATSNNNQNRAIAPPIPTPSPYEMGQQSPPAVSAPGTMQVPPPGATLPPQAKVNSPEQARVQSTAARLYQANPWLTVRPRWYVVEGEAPGLATPAEQTVVVSANLVRSASDGQLAAVMSLQLGDLMVARQRTIGQQAPGNTRRNTIAPPDYYQMSPGQSSSLALLQLDEYAKNHYDPRDLRRQEQQQQQQPAFDSPTCARQLLVQAGYSEFELNQAAPLLQRFPPAR